MKMAQSRKTAVERVDQLVEMLENELLYTEAQRKKVLEKNAVYNREGKDEFGREFKGPFTVLPHDYPERYGRELFVCGIHFCLSINYDFANQDFSVLVWSKRTTRSDFVHEILEIFPESGSAYLIRDEQRVIGAIAKILEKDRQIE